MMLGEHRAQNHPDHRTAEGASENNPPNFHRPHKLPLTQLTTFDEARLAPTDPVASACPAFAIPFPVRSGHGFVGRRFHAGDLVRPTRPFTDRPKREADAACYLTTARTDS